MNKRHIKKLIEKDIKEGVQPLNIAPKNRKAFDAFKKSIEWAYEHAHLSMEQRQALMIAEGRTTEEEIKQRNKVRAEIAYERQRTHTEDMCKHKWWDTLITNKA